MKNLLALASFLPRGIRRGSLFLLPFGIALLFLMATSASAATTWTVQTTDDPGAACTEAEAASCPTLRGAILAAQDGDTIDFKPGLTGTIELAGAMPTISVGITITGPGANLLTISGQGMYQIFDISDTAGSVKISGLTLEDGSATGGGGAIGNEAALTVTGSTFSGNSAGGDGGAIESGGTLTVTGSTFYDNSTATEGGAIESTGTLTVVNSTFSGNSAPDDGDGGAIFSEAALAVTNSTFSGNSAAGDGGAISTSSSASVTLTVTNTIFSGNSADTDGAIDFEGTGNPPTESYNLFYDNAGGDSDFTLDSTDLSSSTSGKKANLNPMLLPLSDFGGPTETMMPEPGSPAICAGDSSSLTTVLSNLGLPLTDQGGFPIAPSVGSCASGKIDIGSVQTNYLLVTNTSPTTDGNEDCNSAGTGTSCSLADAVGLAGGQDYADIGFSPSLGSARITLSQPLSLSQGGTVIIGPPDAVTISGSGSTRILNVSGSSTSVTLYGLTLENGGALFGGAIQTTGGTAVAVTDSTFSGNAALAGGAIEGGGTLTVTNSTFYDNKGNQFSGGAIASGGTLTVTNSTFYNNSALSEGGAIESGGTLTVTNSTFEGNQATFSVFNTLGFGGAIYSFGAATVSNSTFSGNSATGDGGAIWCFGSLTIADNIFASNQAGEGGGIYNGTAGLIFISSAVTDGGYNLFYANNGGDKANFTLNGNDLSSTTSAPGTNLDPDLAPLGNYGGPTPTLLPKPGSAAICAGTTTLPSPLLLPATDQRGFPRTTVSGSTTCIDIGSVETDYQAPTAEVTDYVNSLSSAGVLNHGRSNSLLKKIDQAYEMAGKGKIKGAIHIVNGFAREVNGLYGAGVLTYEQANELLGFANVALESFPSQ